MKSKLNIVCIIPARGGSKGIPCKNIMDFCGKPLIDWSIEQALKSKHIKTVYVSTDDREIAKVAKSCGAKIIHRPDELAGDTSSSEDALLHVLSKIKCKQKIDLVVFLQATSPLRNSQDIDQAIEKLLKENADSLFSAALLEDFCAWGYDGRILKSITYNYLKRGRRQDRSCYFLENGSVYVFKPAVLKKYHNRLGGKIAIYEMPLWKSYEIDEFKDIEICEFYMKNKIFKEGTPKIPLDKVKLIVYDFDGVLTDNQVVIREDGSESVSVSRQDGLAISIFKKHHIPQIILSTESNNVVKVRAKKLGIPILNGVNNKKRVLMAYCQQYKIPLSKVIYVGDEINDFEAMRIVGFPVCPLNAAPEIKKISKIFLPASGGEGAVRSLLRCFCFK